MISADISAKAIRKLNQLKTVNTKLGRNDPCHCGSGKKYKKCHLESDAQQERAERANIVDPYKAMDAMSPAQLAVHLRKMAEFVPQENRAQAAKSVAFAELFARYEARKPEIHAAVEALQAHRQELDHFASHPAEFIDALNTLFSEETFAPLWFSAEEVEAACEQVGYSPVEEISKAQIPTLNAAIGQLVDSTRRNCLTVELFLRLPEFVAAGRFKDAWIINICATDAMQPDQGRTPLLYSLFQQGYEAWQKKRHDSLREFFQEMGLTPDTLKNCSPAQINEWIQTNYSNPESRVKIEAFLAAHPNFVSKADDSLRRTDEDVDWLLDQPDASQMALTYEDKKLLVPFVAEIEEQWMAFLKGRAPSRELSDSEREALVNFMYQATPRIAATVFTPPRTHELEAALRQYLQEKLEANQVAAARAAQSALRQLAQEPDPAKNTYLNGLCFNALRDFPRELFPEAPKADHNPSPAFQTPEPPANPAQA